MKFKGLATMALVLSALLVFTACAPTVVKDDMKKDDKAKQEMVEEEKQEMVEEEKQEMMTEYEIYTLNGEKVNLFDGQKTYVKVWASWCSVCLSGLGEVDELFASDTDFKVTTVVAPGNYGELSEEDFITWREGLSEDYPNIEVLVDRNGDFFSDMGIRAFPTSVYIGSNNEVQSVVIGHNANDAILENMMGIE